MANKNYSAIVEIGGAVKNSFRSSVNIMRGDLSGVGDSVREAREKLDLLNKYDPDGVRKLGREFRDLKRDAAKLRKEYEATAKPTKKMKAELLRAEAAAKKAGKAYQNGREKLDEMGKSLKEAGVNTSTLTLEHRRLSSELEKAKDKMNRLNRAMEAGGRIKEQLASSARIGAGVAAGVGVVGAAVTMTNKATGEQVKLSKSLGVSADSFQAWGGVAREAGFQADTVGDLIEEMNNKLGESAGLEETTPVKESLEMLGLSFQEIQDMKPEEQFKRISEAIKSMPDSQQASAAADILMGGEANKFFGYLRAQEEGLDEILARQKRLNILSKEGRAGAEAYNTAFSRMTTVVGSVAAEISGLIGGALAPLVDEYAPKLADWVKSHKADLVGIGDAIKGAIPAFIAFGRGVFSVFSAVGSAISGVASLLGGFDNLAIAIGMAFGTKAAIGMGKFASNIFTVGKALTPLISGIFPAVVTGIRAIGMAVMANPIGLAITAIVGAALLVWKYWEPISEFFCKIGSVIADGVSKGFDLIKSVFSNFTPLGLVIKHWEPIKAWVGNLFGWIGDKAKKVFGFVGNAIAKVGSFFSFGVDKKETPVVGAAAAEKSTGMTERDKKKLKDAEFYRKHFQGLANGEKDPLAHSYYTNASKDEADKASRIREKYGIAPEVGGAKGQQASVPQANQNLANNNKQQVQNNNITIHAAPGQSEEEIADRVVAKIKETDRDNARLALHD